MAPTQTGQAGERIEPQPGSAPGPDATSSAPDAVAPPPGHPRFPLIDSLRALAALAVLLVHTATFAAWTTPLTVHLDIGVTMFFVLSGFLLYRPFVAARVLRAPGVRASDYARRRFLRIAPAYWLALTVLAIFPGLNGVFTENWWVYYGLLQNYPIYDWSVDCAADPFNCGIAPVWSLGVEVAFYVALPFFAGGVAWVLRRSRRISWVWVEAIILALVSALSLPLVLSADDKLHQFLFFSPMGHVFWFALGMGLAVLSVRVQETGGEPRALRLLSARPIASWVLAAVLYGLASLFIEPGELGPDAVARYLLLGMISALVLLPAVFGDQSRGVPARLLATPWLAWLGLISYGIFLWHWPIAYGLARAGVTDWWPALDMAVITALTLAITIACATASYYLLERPLMRLKHRPTRKGTG